MPHRRKVFCLGYNKSGTTSLHRLFEDLGLRSVHDDRWPAYSRVPAGRFFFVGRHCFTDGEESDFVALDRWFPEAVFILNTRGERAWLKSRVKHVFRYEGTADPEAVLTDPRYGRMAREFVTDPEVALRKWVLERRIYEAQVRRYFRGRPDFLEIDVTTTPDWEERVTAFLRDNGFGTLERKTPGPIHANRREPTEVGDPEALARIRPLIDRALADVAG